MRTIDGTTYLSAKEYAEILGISQARVSQLKATLPIEKFEDLGVELINYELLQLPEKEKALAQLKLSTHVPVHTYSYQQLGVYFAGLLQELLSGRQTAESLLAEKTAQLEKWQELSIEQSEVMEESRLELERLSKANDDLQATNDHWRSQNDEMIVELEKAIKHFGDTQKMLIETQDIVLQKNQEIAVLESRLENQIQLDALVEKVVQRLKQSES